LRNKALLPLLALIIVGVVLSHLELKKDDNGTLLLIDNRSIDIRGQLSNLWTGLRRDCSAVQYLTPDQLPYQQVRQLIQTYSPPSSASAKLFTVISTNEWILAEAEFDELLPAVVLIKKSAQSTNKQMSIIPNAIWSGYTKPWMAAPYIRQYISHQTPEVPENLTDCFDPQSKSFK
jgi:hypothetical protein